MQCFDKDCEKFGVEHVHYCDECFNELEDCSCEVCYFCELKSVLCRDCKLDAEDVCESCCEGHDDDYDKEDDEDEDEITGEDAPVEVYIDPDQLQLPFEDEVTHVGQPEQELEPLGEEYNPSVSSLYRVGDIVEVVEDVINSNSSQDILVSVRSYVLIKEVLPLGEGMSEAEQVYRVQVVSPVMMKADNLMITRKQLGDIMPF